MTKHKNSPRTYAKLRASSQSDDCANRTPASPSGVSPLNELKAVSAGESSGKSSMGLPADGGRPQANPPRTEISQPGTTSGTTSANCSSGSSPRSANLYAV